ncbi:MAG: ABC transporter ATP-binding protein [Pseudomonadota bacterium]
MANVTLENVTKNFGDFTAVDTLNLAVPDAEFVALLGPSGCGKTTTMNMIAGIEAPSIGSVSFDGVDVTQTPVQKRGVGFVFQNYAIFTHMTVRKNLSFGLEVAGRPAKEIHRKVEEMAEFMALTHRLDQPSASLSVNELQKLAIGRSAIVEPKIFLLDEPLSNLDAAFRERMRSDLRQLQRDLKQTMVYVTHDQIEAMSLADRVAVMNKGQLQQFGSPAQVYSEPANVFVARFIGAPSMNIVRASIQHGTSGHEARLGDLAADAIMLDERLSGACDRSDALDVLFGFRPETIEITDENGPTTFGAEVMLVETVGRRKIVHFKTGLIDFLGVFDRSLSIRAGEAVKLKLDLDKCHLFDVKSERCLTLDQGGVDGQNRS